VSDGERREGEQQVPEERPLSEQPEAEDRGEPGIDRAPEGPAQPDRIGTGEPMGAPEGWDRAADLEKDPALIPDLAETDVCQTSCARRSSG
jgi:hypothetical protein